MTKELTFVRKMLCRILEQLQTNVTEGEINAAFRYPSCFNHVKFLFKQVILTIDLAELCNQKEMFQLICYGFFVVFSLWVFMFLPSTIVLSTLMYPIPKKPLRF